MRPVQYEAPGAKRFSRNSSHLYSRPTKRTLNSHSLLRFLQGFLPPGGLVSSQYFRLSECHVQLRFSNRRSNAASVAVVSRSGSTLQCSPSYIAPWPRSSWQIRPSSPWMLDARRRQEHHVRMQQESGLAQLIKSPVNVETPEFLRSGEGVR